MELLGMVLTHEEKFYFSCMVGIAAMEMEGKYKLAVEAINNEEFACVRDGIGCGFQNTKELQVTK